MKCPSNIQPLTVFSTKERNLKVEGKKYDKNHKPSSPEDVYVHVCLPVYIMRVHVQEDGGGYPLKRPIKQMLQQCTHTIWREWGSWEK